MAEQPLLIYWDASVFLDYVNGVPDKLPLLDALLDRAIPGGDVEIVTSMLSITEVAFGYLDQFAQHFDPAIQAKIDALWTDPIIKQVELYKEIAFEARDLVRTARLAKKGLKPPDAIHLATARRIGAVEFHTFDHRLFQYASQLGFPIIEPRASQPRIPGI
ncbi:MAG: type II toxin-antitoxin system VapC family toxin [Chloroflexota bacterium]|nr:type II toxin-antitoxin system VapC family toxin [Chloroflexota bacterium]